jgi:HAD superfamily hydrolase (TIGR01490 family)
MMNNKIKWAIFDLDGTLIPLPSAEWRFACHLYHKGILRFPNLMFYMRFFMRHFPDLGWDARRLNKAYLKGFSAEEIEYLASSFVETSIVPLLRPKTLQALHQHQASGALVVLLSGTIAPIAKALAKRLDIPEVIATEATIERGHYTDLLPKIHPFGKRKKQLAERFALEKGLSLAKAAVYADVFADVYLLEAAGQAVATYPSPPLKKEAKKRGWQIIL